jgi:hypothetical protein
LFFITSPGWSQGTLTVLQTGGGSPLVSSQEDLTLADVSSPELVFEFGFFSNETPAPNVFLDSLTVTLQGSSSGSAVLLTADASGVVWAPLSLGGLSLNDGDIVRTMMTPVPDAPIAGRGVAYSVTVPIPQGIDGPNATLYFDLFDNLDENSSLGWYTTPRIVAVPEPRSMSFFAVALLGLFIIRRKRIHAVAKP